MLKKYLGDAVAEAAPMVSTVGLVNMESLAADIVPPGVASMSFTLSGNIKGDGTQLFGMSVPDSKFNCTRIGSILSPPLGTSRHRQSVKSGRGVRRTETISATDDRTPFHTRLLGNQVNAPLSVNLIAHATYAVM